MIFNRAQGALLLGGFLTYVVMGALVFEILEKDHNKKAIQEVFQLKEDFFLNYTTLNPEEMEIFIQTLIRTVRKGIIPVGEVSYEGHNWDFADSFFFVGTMLATIGYGNVCPQTKEGQIFCVVFAIFGIPFNLICLNYIGFLVSGLFESCAEIVYGRGKKKTARYFFVFVVVGLLLFLILPSLLFQRMEGWTFHEAVYFTFITLSTIGFGDYLIGGKPDRNYFVGYQLLSAVWIAIGLAWIAVVFELLSSLLAPVDSKASSEKKSSRLR